MTPSASDVYGMLPVQPPLPTAWKRPFQAGLPDAPSARGNGSHTSILISESRDGVSVAATRQNAGSAANRRARLVGTSAGFVACRAPAAICSAAVTVASGSLSPVSESHDAASAL